MRWAFSSPVLSNGSLINDDVVALFQELPPTNLRITLYGVSDETYERLCGVRDGFDRVIALPAHARQRQGAVLARLHKNKAQREGRGCRQAHRPGARRPRWA